MAGLSSTKFTKSARSLGCALAALFIGQCLGHAQLSGNGSFVVPLSDPQVSLGTPVLTNGQVQFTLNGEIGVSYVIESSPDFVSWTPVVTNKDFTLVRTIILDADDAHYYRASRAPRSLATYALATRGNMNLNGNGQSTASFNSSDAASSTDGQYDKTKALTNGTIASVQGIINIGNHLIGGNAILGPSAGYTSATIQILGALIFTNRTLTFPDAVLPNVPWLAAPLADSGYDFTTNGYYFINDSSTIVVEPGVTVVLNVTTTPTFQSAVKIHGGTTNSGTAYIFLNGCTNAVLSRNSATDASNRAKNLCYIGLPSLAFLSMADTAVANTPCVIYAPSTDAHISGGGIGGALEGSMVVGSITLNGSYHFYFDEDLLTNGPCR